MAENKALATVEKKVAPVVTEASGMIVTTDKEKKFAVDYIRTVIRPLKAEVKEGYDDIVKSAKETYDKAKTKRKGYLDPLAEAEEVLKKKLNSYDDKVEEDRKKEADRLAELDRKDREKRLKASDTKIEKQLSKVTDMGERISMLEKTLEDPKLTEEDKEVVENKLVTLRAQHENAQKRVDTEKEKKTIVEAQPAPVLTSPVEKTKGHSSKRVKMPVLQDKITVIAAVATGKLTPDILDVNMAKAKKLQNTGVNIPGIGFTWERDTRIRS